MDHEAQSIITEEPVTFEIVIMGGQRFKRQTVSGHRVIMTGFEHIAMAVHVTAGIQGACTVSEMSSGHQIYTAFASRETAVERAVDWLTRCTVDAKQLEQRIQTAIASPAYKEAAHGQA